MDMRVYNHTYITKNRRIKQNGKNNKKRHQRKKGEGVY